MGAAFNRSNPKRKLKVEYQKCGHVYRSIDSTMVEV